MYLSFIVSLTKTAESLSLLNEHFLCRCWSWFLQCVMMLLRLTLSNLYMFWVVIVLNWQWLVL